MMKAKGKNWILLFSVILILISILSVSSEIYANNEKTVVDLSTTGSSGGEVNLPCLWNKNFNDTEHWEECLNHKNSGTFNGIPHTNGKKDIKTHNKKVVGTNTCAWAVLPQYEYCNDGCGYRKNIPKPQHVESTIKQDVGRRRHYTHCINCGNWMTSGLCEDASGSRLGCGVQGTCATCGLVIDDNRHSHPVNRGGSGKTEIYCQSCNYVFGDATENVTYLGEGKSIIEINFVAKNGVKVLGPITGVGSCSGHGLYYTTNPISDGFTSTTSNAKVEINFQDEYFTNVSTHGQVGVELNGMKYTAHIAETAPISPDKTAPTIVSVNPTPNNTSWSNQKMLVATVNENWSGGVQVALSDMDDNILTPYGATTKNGKTFTRTFTPLIETSPSGTQFKVWAKDDSGNETTKTVTLNHIDAAAPTMLSSLDYTKGWARAKDVTFKVKDIGVGEAVVSFNDKNDFNPAKMNNLGNGEYQRDYQFVGDVYDEQTRLVFYKDKIGNEAVSQFKIDKIDNTIPTVRSGAHTLTANNEEATISMTADDINVSLSKSGSGVKGYAMTKTDIEPALSEFGTTRTFNVTKNGKYYLWAIDNVDLISEPYEITIDDIERKISFDPNSGDVDTLSKQILEGALNYGPLPVPTRDKYDFIGWFTSAQNGSLVDENSAPNTNENHTLYAQWERKFVVNTKWIDNDNAESLRPEKIVYKLIRNGEVIDEITHDSTSQLEISNLPTYDIATGTLYKYEVQLEKINLENSDWYDIILEDETFTATLNGEVDLSGTIQWKDQSAKHGTRPETLNLSILQNDTVVLEKIIDVSSGEDSTKFTFGIIEKYDAQGAKYKYHIQQGEVKYDELEIYETKYVDGEYIFDIDNTMLLNNSLIDCNFSLEINVIGNIPLGMSSNISDLSPVSITLQNTETGETINVLANEEGKYFAHMIPIGTYKIFTSSSEIFVKGFEINSENTDFISIDDQTVTVVPLGINQNNTATLDVKVGYRNFRGYSNNSIENFKFRYY